MKQDLIRPRKTISFTGISQPELKEEIKKAVYFQLRIESLETVKKELTAIRRFSRYLNEHKKNVKSCRYLPISTGKRSDIEQGHPTQYQIRI